MTGRSTGASSVQELLTDVECPRCDQSVAVPVPDRDVEPAVSPYPAAFGDHHLAHCPEGHKVWVYYC